MTSVFFVHLVTNNGTGTCTDQATDYGTLYAVLFIDHRAGTRPYGTTDDGTFGGLAPALLGLGGRLGFGRHGAGSIAVIVRRSRVLLSGRGLLFGRRTLLGMFYRVLCR